MHQRIKRKKRSLTISRKKRETTETVRVVITGITETAQTVTIEIIETAETETTEIMEAVITETEIRAADFQEAQLCQWIQ